MVKVSDNTKTVILTEREIDLVLQCIGTNIETVKRRHPMTGSTADLVQELAEMDMDIREQVFRDDGWGDAETQMFTAGVDAREKIKAKASSRAQERRTFNMQRSRDSSQPSETQTHDVWDDNDPKNW
jgi:hypothetical protein